MQGVAGDSRAVGRWKRMRAETEVAALSPRQGDIDAEAESAWMQSETSPDQWARVEEGLKQSNIAVSFAMTETEVEVGRCTWSLQHFTAQLLERCVEGGVKFVRNRLQLKKGGQMLTGVSAERNRDLWMLLKRGIMTLDVGVPPAATRSIRILVRPDYTGNEKSSLTLNEVEYRNCNELRPTELDVMIRQWCGSDVEVVSHTKYQGVEQMWFPIWCMQVAAQTNPVTYAYRLFFPSPDEVNRVYGNYVKATTPRVCHYGSPVDTVELYMVSNVDWDPRRSRLYRTGTDVGSNMCKLMILGLRNEVKHDQLQHLLEQHELQTSSIVIPLSNGRYAEVDFADPATAKKALSRFEKNGQEQLKLGNIPLYVKQKRSPRGCHECGEVDHFMANCPERPNRQPVVLVK